MDQLKFLEFQKQMRENNEDIRDFIDDISNWKSVVEKKSQKFNENVSDKPMPCIRNSLLKKRKRKKETDKPANVPNRIKSYDYKAWDNFDVDKACEEIDIPKPVGDKSDSETDEEAEDQRRLMLAENEKEKGNLNFKEGKYEESIECYTTAIQLAPELSVYYTNRAMALIKLARYASAEVDCTVAISLDSKNIKALFRRALCRKALGNNASAIDDLFDILTQDPNNKPALKEYKELSGKDFLIINKSDIPSTNVSAILDKEVLRTRTGRPMRRIPIVDVGSHLSRAPAEPLNQTSKNLLRIKHEHDEFDKLIADTVTSKSTTLPRPVSSLDNNSTADTPNFTSPGSIGLAVVVQASQPTETPQPSYLTAGSTGRSTAVCSTPTNWIQLERAYRELCSSTRAVEQTDAAMNYLCRLSADRYSTVIGQNLESIWLQRLLRAFTWAESNGCLSPNEVAERLLALTRLPRFDVACLMLDGEDFDEVKLLANKLKHDGHLPADQIDIILAKFL